MQCLCTWGLIRCVHDAATQTNFYSRQGIVINRYLERNLFIGYKHGKEMYVIARFVINSLWKEIITCLWVHHVEEYLRRECFMERKYCKFVGTIKWFCFYDCGRLQFYLTMRPVALEIISPYLSMHIKNVQIGGRTCPVP
jgi:hypothetical protein